MASTGSQGLTRECVRVHVNVPVQKYLYVSPHQGPVPNGNRRRTERWPMGGRKAWTHALTFAPPPTAAPRAWTWLLAWGGTGASRYCMAKWKGCIGSCGLFRGPHKKAWHEGEEAGHKMSQSKATAQQWDGSLEEVGHSAPSSPAQQPAL